MTADVCPLVFTAEIFFSFLKVNYYRCLGLSQTSGAVIHPVQLAYYPVPGVQRPGVKNLGV